MRVEERIEMRMPERGISLSITMLAGLRGLHRYRLLSVDQFARLSGLSSSHTRDVLRRLERAGLLGSIGNVGLRGGSKAPKLYHLTRSGYDAMCEAGGWDMDVVGPFVRAHTGTRWSPIMAHRMAVIDLLVAVESEMAKRASHRLIETLHEYRRVRRPGISTPQPETSDHVAPPPIAANRIVPDAAFVIENVASGGRGLYLVELDRGTERLASRVPDAYSVRDKLLLYERYLRGGRFREFYRGHGDFRFFTLLFVTTSAARIANLREASAGLATDLHPYFRLAECEDAKRDPFAPVWLSRDPTDERTTSIIKHDQSGGDDR